MSTFVTSDGTEIFYKDWGTGWPVVFSHGVKRSPLATLCADDRTVLPTVGSVGAFEIEDSGRQLNRAQESAIVAARDRAS